MKIYIDQAHYQEWCNSIEVVMCEYGTQNNTNAEWITVSIALSDLNSFIRKRYPNEQVIDVPDHEGEHKQTVIPYIHQALEHLEKYAKEYIESGKEVVYLTPPTEDEQTELF
jgi:hypothetical protein